MDGWLNAYPESSTDTRVNPAEMDFSLQNIEMGQFLEGYLHNILFFIRIGDSYS